MEIERLKLEAEHDNLENRLKALRVAIKGKRNNINDLESVLQQDIEKLRSFPIYYYFSSSFILPLCSTHGVKPGESYLYVISSCTTGMCANGIKKSRCASQSPYPSCSSSSALQFK